MRDIACLLVVRWMRIKPVKYFVYLEEESESGMEGIVVLFVLQAIRNEVFRYDMKMKMPARQDKHRSQKQSRGTCSIEGTVHEG